MEDYFRKTFEHPILKPYIELVSTDFLLRIANPNPGEKTDLGFWDNNILVDMEALMKNIKKHGMRDPMIVGVGRCDGYVRLEAGNHRVRLFHKEGIKYVPAVAYVGDYSITHIGNGEHLGEKIPLKIKLTSNILGPYPIKEYKRLSDIIKINNSEKIFIDKN